MKLLRKEFMNYAVPSVIGMLVSALYIVIDGIFVGRGVGSSALASINIALPITTLVIAITMMVTMGGATLMSIKFGQNKHSKGNDIFLQSIFLIIAIIGVVSIISILFSEQLTRMLGASDELFKGASEYLRYYMMFGLGFSGSLALSTFVRNDGSPKLAMISLILGASTNIALDYTFIFIFKLGIIGAAVASGLGQLASVLLLLTHFIGKKGKLKLYMPKLRMEELIRILKAGTPEFIVQISPAVSIFAFNLVIMKRIGEIGIASFSIIGYISVILFALFIGISQGIQPLLSYSHGKGDFKKVGEIKRLGVKTNFVLSLIVYVSLLIFGENIIGIFNGDEALIKLTYDAMIIYGFSFVIASINIVHVTYYQSIANPKAANVISISRGMVFIILFLIILPMIIGDIGIWISIILSEICTLFLLSR